MKIIIILIVLNLINLINSQLTFIWTPTSNGCEVLNYENQDCWTPNTQTPSNMDLISFSTAGTSVFVKPTTTLTSNITTQGVTLSQDVQMTITDSTLNVQGPFSMDTTSRLTLNQSDTYFKSLVSGVNKNFYTVLMDLSSIPTLSATSFSMSGNSILDIFRSKSTIKGPLIMEGDSSIYMISRQNADAKFEVESSVLNGNSFINFQGQSYILLNNTKSGGIQLNSNSKLVGLNADNIQITGPLNLAGSSKIQLTSSQLYLDSLTTSATSTITVLNSTLSIMGNSTNTFAPGEATFTNSVFSVHTNSFINSPITMINSVYSFNCTTTLNSVLTGTNVYLLLDTATFNGGGHFNCQGCSVAMRNSTFNLNTVALTYENDGDILMATSSFLIGGTATSILSKSGNIYGYYGVFNKGLTLETGSLGVYNEKTRLDINGNVIIQSGAKIQLYLTSPLDFSWLNITGSLDVQIGSIVEIYVYTEILNNAVMEVIKSGSPFVTPLSNDNVKLFTYDPDNEEINSDYVGCEYTLSFTTSTVTVSTNYACQEVTLLIGTNGLSKGSLAGISVGMVSVAFLVSFGVWWKTTKNQKQYKNKGTELSSYSSKSYSDSEVKQ